MVQATINTSHLHDVAQRSGPVDVSLSNPDSRNCTVFHPTVSPIASHVLYTGLELGTWEG